MAWMDGKGSKVMVTTLASNDSLPIWLVIHADKLFNMLEYVQGQGRAGYDAMPAICHTLMPTKLWKESSKEDKVERSNKQAILNHLYLYGTKHFLRYGIALYIDSIGTDCH